MLRLLVVARSAELRSLVERALRVGSGLELVGAARTQAEAVDAARRLKPDLIVVEPRLGSQEGAAVVTEIMVETPTPIVVVTHDANADLGSLAVQALAAGALAIMPAPELKNEELDEASARKFLSSLASMSQVKVVRRWRGRPGTAANPPQLGCKPIIRVVGVAASTGGPAAIKAILKELPSNFPAPILIVQHIASGYIEAIASSLGAVLPLRVKVAENGDLLVPGTVYLAPDGHQMGCAGRKRIRVVDDPPIDGFRPSGTHLFTSMAHAFGNEALAIVLTGMGRDGTAGLGDIRAANGLVMAQDAESSVVFGMPKAAIDSGFVDAVLSLDEMPAEIVRLAGLL